MTFPRSFSAGFSLVELSIVLVILGLLVGGILAGQNLIRAAEMRAVTTEFSRYQTVIQTFREKYFAMPGDMKNATAFWGNADTGTSGGDCAAPESDIGTGTQTCNGDGDGMIEYSPSSEIFRVWQHMANAGLIEGTYNGVTGPTTSYHHQLGVNAPTSKLNNAGWGIRSTAPAGGSTYAGGVAYFAFVKRYTLAFGSVGTGGSMPLYPVLTPAETWNIDKKIDDGKPAKGRVTMRSHDSGICTNAADVLDLEADYNLSSDSIACAIEFMQVY